MSAADHLKRLREKPRLLIENSDPHRTVSALRDVLADAGELYDRGVPVRLAFDQMQKGAVAQVMTPDALVLTAHAVSRPYVVKPKKDALDEVDVRVHGNAIDVSPITDASAPVVLGRDLRDLGAAVAVRLVESLGGAVGVDSGTLTIRL